MWVNMKSLHGIILDAGVGMRPNLEISKPAAAFAATGSRQNCTTFKHNPGQALMTFHMTFIWHPGYMK